LKKLRCVAPSKEPRRKEGKHGQFRGRDAKRANDSVVNRVVKDIGLNKKERRRLHDMLDGSQDYDEIKRLGQLVKGRN